MARMLAAVVVAGLALGIGGAQGRSTSAQKCLYQVVFEGSTYHLIRTDGIQRGERVGAGVKPGCNDTFPGPPAPDVPITVFRYGSASPRVALTVRESDRDFLIAVPGRCAGFGFTAGYLRCLRTEVRYRGRGYSAMRGRELPRGKALGRGSIAGRPVPLQAIQGVDPRVAVARAGNRLQIWIAHRRCELGAFDKLFMRCIRGPLWLRISGEGTIRTATVEHPGSLLRNVQLPLYLAPDAVADEIVSAQDERLTRTGQLAVDARGRGSARIAIIDSVDTGSYAVMAQLPQGRMVTVGALSFFSAPRRD